MKKLIFLSLVFMACSSFDWPCHPNGDVGPCGHRVHTHDIGSCNHYDNWGNKIHDFDYYPCTHRVHDFDYYPCVHYCN